MRARLMYWDQTEEKKVWRKTDGEHLKQKQNIMLTVRYVGGLVGVSNLQTIKGILYLH